MRENNLHNIWEIYITDQIRSLSNYFKLEWLNVKTILGNKFLLVSLILGVIIRLFLAPFLGHPYDLRVFMAVGWAVANGITPYGEYVLNSIFTDLAHPHLHGFFYGIGYPPLWGLVLGSTYKFFSSVFPKNVFFYVFTLKLPILIGDILVGFLLYRIIKKKLNSETASKIFYFYLLCPFLIIIGATWGMFDILVFLFSIISSYTIFNNSDLSAVSLALATSFKPYAVILIPLYSIFIFKKFFSLKKAFRYIIVSCCLIGFLTLIPMLVFKWPISNLYNALASHMTSTDFYYQEGTDYTYGAASPFNVFNVLRLITPGIKPPNFLNYIWIIACLSLYAYVIIRSPEPNFKNIINYTFITSLFFFTTRFWVSEQNLIFLLSFFVLSVLFNGTRNKWWLIHFFWILLTAFVLVHVPATGFLWIVQPWMLNAATEFCNGPLGYLRWIAMSVLTLSWNGFLFWYAFKERMIR